MNYLRMFLPQIKLRTYFIKVEHGATRTNYDQNVQSNESFNRQISLISVSSYQQIQVLLIFLQEILLFPRFRITLLTCFDEENFFFSNIPVACSLKISFYKIQLKLLLRYGIFIHKIRSSSQKLRHFVLNYKLPYIYIYFFFYNIQSKFSKQSLIKIKNLFC